MYVNSMDLHVAAVCERCGAIGVKHSFYTKERNFCSMACARGKHGKTELGRDKNDDGDSDEVLSTMDSEYDGPIQKSNYRFKISDQDTETSNSLDDEKSVLFRDVLPQEELPELAREDTLLSPCPQEERILSVRHKPSEFVHSYDWTPMLNKNNGIFAAPVTCFPHAPGYDMWDNIIGPSGVINNKVEVENTDVDNQGITATTGPHSFWVATVLKVCGYKALLRYEGFDTDSSHDLWVNLCSSEVHPVGWCATRGKPLIPPQTIELKYSDWKEFLVKRLSGASTLPSTFYNKISDSFKSRFKCGMNLEVVDKGCISKVKLATIQKIIGKRLFVHYYDSPSDDGFWCHEDSPLIHPVGWAATVGHKLSAPSSYIKRMQAGRDQIIESNENDTTYDLFKINFTFEEYSLSGRKSRFQQGMKLEAIDPLNLSSICVATVMSVLKYGYMMIRIDSCDPDVTGSDWFCYHEHSPCIFPPGFCQSNDIILTPPKGYSAATFEWNRYLHDTKSIPATRDLFNLEIPKHGFEEGMKVECADLMDPRLVCVATISRVVGRLLKVHFDGWEEEYDQWLDCESPDMYPVGWCFLVGHKLEEPKAPPPVPKPLGRPLGRRRKKEKKKAEGVKTGKSPVSGIVKKEHDDTRGSSVSSDSTRGNTSIKQEIKLEAEDDDEYEDEYSESGQSTSTTYTIATPEPLPAGSNRRSAGSYSNINTTPGIQSQAPPQERKVTSYINSSSVNTGKYIPQINASSSVTGSSNSGNSITESCPSDGTDELCPDTWNIYDVSQFLRVNDCTAHCETFSRHKVDGKKLLALTKDEIITMLGNRLGPAIKIFVLIQELNKLVTKELKKKRSKEYL